MSDVPATSPPESKRDKTTRDRLAEAQNMSPKEIRSYLDSDEFKKHGSKAIAGNAQRLLKIMASSSVRTSLEDSKLMKDALSAIDRAKYASGDDHDAAVCKARAYGYDPAKTEDQGDLQDKNAPPSEGGGTQEEDGSEE